ncbi:MAG: type II secretion system F family protein [Lachnospiraceae bacterium]
MVLAGIFFSGCIILLFLSKKMSLEKEWKTSKLTAPFYKAAAWIFQKTRKRIRKYYDNQKEKLHILQPSQNIETEERNYFVHKMAITLMLLTFGLGIVLLAGYSSESETILKNGNLLARKEVDGKSYEMNLDVRLNDQTLENIPLEIHQRKYTEEELEAALLEFYPKLEEEFCGENQSTDCINTNVNLCTEIDGYPFEVEWNCDDWNVIDREGQLGENIDENGQIVLMSAAISYEDRELEYSFPVMVFPKVYSEEELLIQRLTDVLKISDKETETEEYWKLPMEMDGMEIYWTEKKTNNTLIFFILILVAAVGIFMGKDRELSSKLEKRQEEMLQDYSEIVSKITLFVGAGMSVRGAFQRIAYEYRETRKKGAKYRYAYEEMLYTTYEMESGVEEMTAYRHFTKRCRIQKYVKFGALLEQYLKKGGRGFIDTLNQEAFEALEDRKNEAQKLGEQAGTKLLVPMFMMLLIVMVMIMVPAFMGM